MRFKNKIIILILPLFIVAADVAADVYVTIIDTFSSGNIEETIAFPPASSTVGVDLPDNIAIAGAYMSVSGLDTLSKLDLVFIIDTSVSMDNEWVTLCNKIDDIVDDLEISKGVDTEATIYGLGIKYSAGSCEDAVISHNTLVDATGGVNLEDANSCGVAHIGNTACEAWMAGIIWASDPANASGTTHIWRADTAKIIIPISDETDDSHKAVLAGTAITAATSNDVMIYGLWGADGNNDADNYMMYISSETQGITGACSGGLPSNPVPNTVAGWETKCPDTGATLFSNGPALNNLIIEAITVNISDIEIDVGNDGSAEWIWTGGLGLDNSPQNFEFEEALNNYFISVCNSAACNVPIKVSSLNNGTIKLHDLVITTITITGGLVPCGRTFDNPKTFLWDERTPCDLCFLLMLINKIINFLLALAATIAMLALVITGFLFITSAGNEERRTSAKRAFKMTLIGFLIIFLSWLMIDFLLSAWGYLDPLGGKWNIVCD